MVSKNTKSKRRAADNNAAGSSSGAESPSAANANDSLPSVSTPGPSNNGPDPAEDNEIVMEDDTDLPARAEKVKEQGNVAFKAGRYDEAIKLYTNAIELNSNEPAYLTNRAASYMGIKKFQEALEDCQQALTIQAAPTTPSGSSPSPPIKTLLRLARCQVALGSPVPALSTLKLVLDVEPKNAAAVQLKAKIAELDGHLKTFEDARQKKNWGLARLALDKAGQCVDGDGPLDWRLWRVELELAKGNWDGANNAASDALRLYPNSPEILTLRGLVLFLCGKLAQSLQHLASALRFDPSHLLAQQLRKRVKDVERLKEEGNALFKSGKLDDAITKYTEALDRIGEAEEEGKGGQIRATLLSNRATTLVKLKRHEDALADTDRSLELFPSSFKALRTRARIHLHLENFDKAIADFKSAIQEAQTDANISDQEVRALSNELKKSEVALKRSKTKDYYKILGVARDCTESEIKKAYRRESLKHHPDKGGDEEKFKLVVEANAVLSDPERRERYDAGDDEDGMTDGGFGMGGMGGHMHGLSPEMLSQMFAQFGGGGFGGGGASFGGGGFHGGGSRRR